MSQSVLHCTSHPQEARNKKSDDFVRQLFWVLVTALLFLYAATSYIYWAKIESTWPIFR